jgi:hypothetical protein
VQLIRGRPSWGPRKPKTDPTPWGSNGHTSWVSEIIGVLQKQASEGAISAYMQPAFFAPARVSARLPPLARSLPAGLQDLAALGRPYTRTRKNVLRLLNGSNGSS